MVSTARKPRWYSSRSPGAAAPTQPAKSISARRRAARVVVNVVCFIDMISLLCSYSRPSRTVSRRPRAMGGEDAAEVAEAAVEGRARAEAPADEAADRALRHGGAEGEVARFERTEGSGQIDPAIRRLDGADAAAVPGGEPVFLGEPVGQRPPVAARRVEREEVASRRPALPAEARRDAGGLVAQDDAGEGADAAAPGVEGRQAPDQVEEQILTQVIEIGARQAARGARDAWLRRRPRPAG